MRTLSPAPSSSSPSTARPSGTAGTDRRARLGSRAVLAAAGTAVVAIAAADLLNPGYSPVTEVISRYVNGPAGWLITTALFLIAGASGHLGARLPYAVQTVPRGLADALLVAADFIGGRRVALVLGDNVFHAPGLPKLMRREIAGLDGCTLFGSRVPDPHRYGVAAPAPDGSLLGLEEKPAVPRSDLAVTGLCLYDNEAVRYAAGLTPSARGELEITDLNRRFLAEGRARLVPVGPGTTWMDAGTPDSLLDAGVFARRLHRRGVPFPTLEDAARTSGFLPEELPVAADARVRPRRTGRGSPSADSSRAILRRLCGEPRRIRPGPVGVPAWDNELRAFSPG
ncbi:sugar phosphate nucleotidyltransferase [Streptomyces sp. CC208A]|uniref:sugar nucleotidyltransferase n=1 Tax=Streptomyces sp. CC208A TaxID=3044573 RepID=UPI0024A86AA4|nr:sugar phosphate nucleotidyltransferase [Streptomyces sp. CC208A]